MKRELRIILSKRKETNASFLVALIPVVPIPSELICIDDITDCAVIAANDIDGNNIYSYVHLESDEKQFIGDALANSCIPLNEWVWCDLFDNS